MLKSTDEYADTNYVENGKPQFFPLAHSENNYTLHISG